NSCWHSLAPGTSGYPVQYNPYTFGRVEGAPERLGHPMVAYLETTDTDKAYNITGAVHEYIALKFGRNGANNQGGMGNGTTASPTTQTHVTVNTNGTTGSTCTSIGYWWDSTKAQIRFCVGNALPDNIAHEY